MKRRVKTALVIIGIGGLLIIIGVMMGGNIKKTFYKYGDEGWNMDDEHKSVVLATDMHEVQLVSDSSIVKQLKADIAYAALRIEPHDKQSIDYSITNNTKRIGAAVQVEGKTLKISTKKNHKWHWNWLFGGWNAEKGGRSKTVITVKIPQNIVFDTVSMNIGAASLILDGFTAAERFTLNTGAGEVTIKDITASNVNIKTGVGESTFQNCIFTDTVLNTGVGETSFEGKILKNLDINAGIGEIDMQINGKKTDYSINATTGIGSILIDGRNAAGIDSTFRVNNQDSLHSIRIKAGIGEIAIKFTE